MSFGLEGRSKPFGGVFELPTFQVDYRIGGQVTGVLGGPKLTLFPDEIRKCVAFACLQSPTRMIPVGTVFFVSVRLNNDLNAIYLVTAKHVIDGIRNESSDGLFYLRINRRDGSTLNMRTKVDDWLFHPSDSSVDVAVLPFGTPVELMNSIDFRALPAGMFVTKEIISKETIGIGDSIFLTGLFTGYSGQQRNIPIVRIGNIAAMPEEPVSLEGFGDAEAYLVEARSIGGLSGSPVFVNLGLVRVDEKGEPVFYRENEGGRTTSGAFYLLGLMHGHWDSEPHHDVDKDWRNESVNLGIAIVIPAAKIREVLDQPRLEQQRKFVLRETLKGSLPRQDR